MSGKQLCPHDDLTHFSLHDLADLLEQRLLTLKQVEQLFRRVNERYQNRDVLTDEELTALRELRAKLTDRINPYSADQLDKRVQELNAKFPDWEHGYHQIGKTVTWYDRRRAKEL
jgi:hypothetical protein